MFSIVGAVNMPWDSSYLQAHYGELAADHDIIVVCWTGYRSDFAANFLESMGFTHVFDMLGGMRYWEWETEGCDSAVEPRMWGAVKALFR